MEGGGRYRKQMGRDMAIMDGLWVLGDLGSGLPGVGGVVLRENELVVPVGVAAEEESLGAPKLASLIQRVAAVFRSIITFICETIAWLSCCSLRGHVRTCVPSTVGDASARLPPSNVTGATTVLAPAGDTLGAAALPSPQDRGAKAPFLCVPSSVKEIIFYHLGLRDKQALSMCCKSFGTDFQEVYQRRCQLLLAADKEHPLFKRFGINCPEEDAPSHARMEAMIARIEPILASTKKSLKIFPKNALGSHTARGLVMRGHPKRVHELLEIA